MSRSQEQSGLGVSLSAGLLALALLQVPLGVVSGTWKMLGVSLLQHGRRATFPHVYDVYLFGLLIALTLLQLYVARLGRNAKDRTLQLLRTGNGIFSASA